MKTSVFFIQALLATVLAAPIAPPDTTDDGVAVTEDGSVVLRDSKKENQDDLLLTHAVVVEDIDTGLYGSPYAAGNPTQRQRQGTNREYIPETNYYGNPAAEEYSAVNNDGTAPPRRKSQAAFEGADPYAPYGYPGQYVPVPPGDVQQAYSDYEPEFVPQRPPPEFQPGWVPYAENARGDPYEYPPVERGYYYPPQPRVNPGYVDPGYYSPPPQPAISPVASPVATTTTVSVQLQTPSSVTPPPVSGPLLGYGDYTDFYGRFPNSPFFYGNVPNTTTFNPYALYNPYVPYGDYPYGTYPYYSNGCYDCGNGGCADNGDSHDNTCCCSSLGNEVASESGHCCLRYLFCPWAWLANNCIGDDCCQQPYQAPCYQAPPSLPPPPPPPVQPCVPPPPYQVLPPLPPLPPPVQPCYQPYAPTTSYYQPYGCASGGCGEYYNNAGNGVAAESVRCPRWCPLSWLGDHFDNGSHASCGGSTGCGSCST